jgi:hypothetical protein
MGNQLVRLNVYLYSRDVARNEIFITISTVLLSHILLVLNYVP